MKIASTTYDVTRKIESFDNFYKELSQQILFFLDQEVEILLFPEYFLLKILEINEISKLQNEEEKLSALQFYVFEKLIPNLQKEFAFYKNQERCLILGSCFFQENGAVVNRSSILMKDKVLFYDKRALTPWEKTLRPGAENLCFDFKGVKCSVLICFDIEIPEFSIELRKEKVELLFVPSVTEGQQGFERVQRCASARSVELCCYVVVSHLVGKSSNEMINQQVGVANYYVPSQSLTYASKATDKQFISNGEDYFVKDFDFEILRKQRLIKDETNPFFF
jgi:predicted amidohydrolase